jgi:hypothetical protein
MYTHVSKCKNDKIKGEKTTTTKTKHQKKKSSAHLIYFRNKKNIIPENKS